MKFSDSMCRTVIIPIPRELRFPVICTCMAAPIPARQGSTCNNITGWKEKRKGKPDSIVISVVRPKMHFFHTSLSSIPPHHIHRCHRWLPFGRQIHVGAYFQSNSFHSNDRKYMYSREATISFSTSDEAATIWDRRLINSDVWSTECGKIIVLVIKHYNH